MASPNIANTTSIIGKTLAIPVNISPQPIITNDALSGKVFKLNSVIVSNVNGVLTADINVYLTRGGSDFYLAKTITVPADATLIVISKDMGIYLEEGDVLYCSSSADGYLNAIASYEEFTDV